MAKLRRAIDRETISEWLKSSMALPAVRCPRVRAKRLASHPQIASLSPVQNIIGNYLSTDPATTSPRNCSWRRSTL